MMGDLIHNNPVVSHIFANLVTIGLAILGSWDAATVMFVYWAQSVIIGSVFILALGVLRITTTLPVLVLFLLLKMYSDISAHLIRHHEKENPDAPVRYL